MKKLLVLLSLLATPAFAGEPVFLPKCYEGKEFTEKLAKANVITMFNGFTSGQPKKVIDILIGLDRKAYVIEYEAKEPVAQYCVTTILSDVTLNDKAIQFFNKLLQKTQGQDT